MQKETLEAYKKPTFDDYVATLSKEEQDMLQVCLVCYNHKCDHYKIPELKIWNEMTRREKNNYLMWDNETHPIQRKFATSHLYKFKLMVRKSLKDFCAANQLDVPVLVEESPAANSSFRGRPFIQRGPFIQPGPCNMQ